MSVLPPAQFFCNSCLCELTLFDDATTSGSRIQKRYLTNCYHILCHICRMRTPDQCAACNKKCQFMAINSNMPTNYRSYFEPTLQLRTNLIGAIAFQRTQIECVISRTLAEGKILEQKCQSLDNVDAETNKTHQKSYDEFRKIRIIFDQICEEKRRRQNEGKGHHDRKYREAEREKSIQRLASPNWCNQQGYNWTPGFGANINFPQTPQNVSVRPPARTPSRGFNSPSATPSDKF